MVSIVTMASSIAIVSESEDTFCEAVSFSLSRALWCVSKGGATFTVKAVYEGQDVFICLPTGYGKSLCYQTLPLEPGVRTEEEWCQSFNLKFATLWPRKT